MAAGWVLVTGIVALVAVVVAALVIIRTREVPSRATARLVTMGPLLVILGIVFGEDRLFAYGFIGSGVLVSLAGAYLDRRRGPS
jgi:hypothetical protein